MGAPKDAMEEANIGKADPFRPAGRFSVPRECRGSECIEPDANQALFQVKTNRLPYKRLGPMITPASAHDSRDRMVGHHRVIQSDRPSSHRARMLCSLLPTCECDSRCHTRERQGLRQEHVRFKRSHGTIQHALGPRSPTYTTAVRSSYGSSGSTICTRNASGVRPEK